jgi:hypothetical protein
MSLSSASGGQSNTRRCTCEPHSGRPGCAEQGRCAARSLLCPSKFPVRLQIFPVSAAREFCSQTIEFPTESRGASVISSPKSANFPVFSPGTGKLTGRDGFADDCLHRQLVSCFCKTIWLSGIGANYPGVRLRKIATTGSREPNLGSPTACSKQFSQVPTSRFGSIR